ncbi:hypothetical protein J5N97_008292 [Dioscorea zingiberensis]|uniref:DUF4283 domain-containing protein n=1 Tax=Dioscorea zingiberensis TaxID=325984 RepID=A0A9D5DDM0_9LILI|nr:hypothetical protein J5N97_008292 [Dioscorea zingiberensis]
MEITVPTRLNDEGKGVGKWKLVQSKRSRKQASSELRRRLKTEPEPTRRSPPTIQTPAGPIQVCGQCLKPGHRADGCRREIVCRRCNGTGYRAHQCRNPRATVRHLMPVNLPRRQEEPEGHAPLKLMENPKKRTRPSPEPEQQGKREVKYNIQHISVSMTNKMLKGKEKLRSLSIATVTEVREGLVNAAAITGSLTEALKGCTSKVNWNWEAKPFLDGWYLVACPSAAAARELERGGVIHLLKFSLCFEQCTTDMWPTERADGERRTVIIRHLPVFSWDHHSVALLLRTVGDLVYVKERGTEAVEILRAVMRIRRGQLLPVMLKATIDYRKYTITVDLERGEPPLPWVEDPDLRPTIHHPEQVLNQAPAKAPWPRPKETLKHQAGGSVVMIPPAYRGWERSEEQRALRPKRRAIWKKKENSLGMSLDMEVGLAGDQHRGEARDGQERKARSSHHRPAGGQEGNRDVANLVGEDRARRSDEEQGEDRLLALEPINPLVRREAWVRGSKRGELAYEVSTSYERAGLADMGQSTQPNEIQN